jgi:hypothetical protein
MLFENIKGLPVVADIKIKLLIELKQIVPHTSLLTPNEEGLPYIVAGCPAIGKNAKSLPH